MMNLKIRFFFLAAYIFVVMGTLFIPHSVDALAVTVKRVTFEGKKRAEVITIINNSNHEETYRLGWKHFVMSESKGLQAVPEDALPPEVKPSKDMVRFSPRRFTLPSKGSQQVRMMLRMPSGVEDGEYRSHLWIRPEENVEAYRERIRKGAGKKSGVFMQMLAGTSMPIIVRKGALTVSTAIEGLSAERESDGNIVVKFDVTREGEKSAYGDLDFICNKEGEWYLLKFVRGFSVYPETPRRSVARRVAPKEDAPRCNSLTIRYTETDGFAGEMMGTLAEAVVPVQ